MAVSTKKAYVQLVTPGPFDQTLETLRAAKDDLDAKNALVADLYAQWREATDQAVIAEGAFKDAREALFDEAVK